MSSKCLQHSQHHCIHAHNCDNPLHKQGLNPKIPPNNHNSHNTQQSKKQVCKSGIRKPPVSSSLGRAVSPPNTKPEKGELRVVSPECKDLDYERMFLNLNQKWKQMDTEMQSLSQAKEQLETELQAERAKNTELTSELQKKKSISLQNTRLQAELGKLQDTKGQLSSSEKRNRSMESEIAKLKHLVETVSSERDRAREQLSKNLRKTGEVEEDFSKENKEKEHLKRKLQESQSVIEDLQAQHKNIMHKSKGSMAEVIEDYEKRLKALDQKFSFSCDQLSEIKKVESKLRNQLKQSEQDLNEWKSKAGSRAKPQEPSKVEKELLVLKEKGAKENQRLRESLIDYQHEKRQIEEQLDRTTAKFTDEIRQLEKLLQIKESEIAQLENVQVTSEKHVNLMRENQGVRDKERQVRQYQHKEAGEHESQSKQAPNLNTQTHDLRGTYSETIAIRHLQNRNAELERLVQELKISEPGNTISVNDYNEFEKVIKDNNKRIKELILEKGREMENNSRLMVEVQELKNQIHSRNTSTTSNSEETQREHRVREAANHRNQIESLTFEIQKVKAENFEINSKYSDYYILKEDNEALSARVEEMVRLVETLKKSVIHNSFQKEALICDNQQLSDQMQFYSSYARYP